MSVEGAFVALVLNWLSLAVIIINFTDVVIEMGGNLQITFFAHAFRSFFCFVFTAIWGSLSDSLGRKKVVTNVI